MGFTKKHQKLLTLAADIMVIRECSQPSIEQINRSEGWSSAWFGSNHNKGLGVLVKTPWTIRESHGLKPKWTDKAVIDDPASIELFLVWACTSKSPATEYIEHVVVSRVFRTFVEAQIWWCSAPPRGSRKFSRARSCCFARFRKPVHVQIPPHALVRAGHVPQPCRRQHQRRLSIRKCAYRPRSSSHFAQQPLQWVVRSQTPPVFAWKLLPYPVRKPNVPQVLGVDRRTPLRIRPFRRVIRNQAEYRVCDTHVRDWPKAATVTTLRSVTCE
jgi:hypothetical protein